MAEWTYSGTTIPQGMVVVDGVTMPCPSGFTWGLMDISKAESGRDSVKGKMNKARVCQKRKISLEWIMKTPDEVSKILKAFNPEYIRVAYHDAMENKVETREFYVGDRTAPVKFWWLKNQRYEKVSFEIIER